MLEPVFYLNGKFILQSRALLSILDLGLLRGYGVFDFLVTYGRKPFRLADHIKRLKRSAETIGLNFPWSERELSNLVDKTMDANPEGEKSIRIIVTGGESEDLLTPVSDPSLGILVMPYKKYPKEYYEKGVKVITFTAKREIPGAKTLNYIFGVRALMKAKKVGAVEAIYHHDNRLYEGVSSNLFSIKDEIIVTASEDVLEGITRRTVLDLIEDKYPIEFRHLKTSEVDSIDEAFLTASNKEVMPVTRIDDKTIGDGMPGEITKNVMNLFTGYTDQLKG